MSILTFRSPEIQCDGCARSLRAALGALPGVRRVDVDVAERNVTVEFDEAAITDEELLRASDEAGFPAEA